MLPLTLLPVLKPKKHLGQHFLRRNDIARRIAEALPDDGPTITLEVGPGTGVLTQYLQERPGELWLAEVDPESVRYLEKHYPQLRERLHQGDFLQLPIPGLYAQPLALIGNFPYNISSQIVFKMLIHRDQIPVLVGMFQKEVAERLVAEPGSKTYGILSVLCAAYYHREYLFTVEREAFQPPPKVLSGVIRMVQRSDPPEVNYERLLQVVKAAFNQRRKTLRNSLKGLPILWQGQAAEWLGLRPEQLSYHQFVLLAQQYPSDIT